MINKNNKIDNAIFLDIDGVLNSEKYFIQRGKTINKKEEFLTYDLDRTAVELLNHIINKTNAIIVLSSSWRMYGLNKVNKALKIKGLTHEIKFMTTKEDKPRGLQIKEFIDKHKISNYVVLDDEDFDIKDHIPDDRIFKISEKTGLQSSISECIVERLNNK